MDTEVGKRATSGNRMENTKLYLTMIGKECIDTRNGWSMLDGKRETRANTTVN